MIQRNFVYASARIENGRSAVELSDKYEICEGWTTPRIAFVGADADAPGSIAVHRFTNEADGGVVYAPSEGCSDGWVEGPVAFYAHARSGEDRIEMSASRMAGPDGDLYLTAPSDGLSEVEEVQTLGTGAFFVQAVDKSRWMEQTPAIHTKKLRHICLPCAHDAATAVMQDIKTDDNGEDIAGFLNTLKKIGDDIAATGIGIVIDIPLWLADNLFGVVKGLGRAQSQSIKGQLEGGIRGLDLRVYYYAEDDTFYTYHGALGEKLETVLDEIGAFLASRIGEIVFLTFTHSRHVSSQGLKDRLTNMIQSKIGAYAYTRTGTNDDTLFDQTYGAIVGQNQTGSKAIIVYSEAVAPEFWPASYTGQGSSKIAGFYSNSSDIGTMLAKQIQQYEKAKAEDKPFSLFMTLTPQESDVYDRVAGAIAGPLAAAALLIIWLPWVFAAVEALAVALAIYNATLSWRTLEELTETLSPTLAQKVQDNFVPATGPNLVSLVWVDFYEKSGIVDLAITLSEKS